MAMDHNKWPWELDDMPLVDWVTWSTRWSYIRQQMHKARRG